MKKLLKKISSFFAQYDPFTEAIEEEQRFIDDNEEKAEQNLVAHGWNILSVGGGVITRHYKIQRGDSVVEVSIREALKIK